MLGVSRTATDQEIKSAYRKMALQFHPDRNPDNPDAEEKFKEATEAYTILADSSKRALYDRFGHAGVGSAGPAGGGFDATIFQDFSDIFGDFFGFGDLFGMGGGRKRSRAQRGRPVLASGGIAAAILARIERLSRRYGTAVAIEGESAVVKLG